MQKIGLPFGGTIELVKEPIFVIPRSEATWESYLKKLRKLCIFEYFRYFFKIATIPSGSRNDKFYTFLTD